MRHPDDVLDYCEQCRRDASAVHLENVRDQVVGLDRQAPLYDGGSHTYVNLDNAATTPPFTAVVRCMTRFFEWYSSVHRGAGFKSRFSTHMYHQCREAVAEFVGADLSYHTLIFTQNATHALNKLALRLDLPPGSVVLATEMEHHSNLLPWRKVGGTVDVARVRPEDGSLDLDDLARRVVRHAGRLRLVAVTAASNVTGLLPPIRRIARLAHEHGALLAVDATQLVPHRPFALGAPDDPERVDFAAFSAHKMYAPFGSGVLIGPRHVFEQGAPDVVGGGTIEGVTLDRVIWAAPPEKDEAGTPNLPGAVALAATVQTLRSIGMEALAEHERALTRRLLEGLARIGGITLYGPGDAALAQDRLAVVPLNLDRLGHAATAAALAYEWGIGVRNGCFCAQPYVRRLLGVGDAEMRAALHRLAAGDHVRVPGMVRVSLGVYNTADEVDYLIEALRRLAADGPRARYVLDPASGECVPEGCDLRLDEVAPFRAGPTAGEA